ncbi:MAG: S8 family serine peptidase, partial [Bacteroidetes bacterium]|nr:S8 family serine peptidase [Bacteroidota bacterium]
PGTFETFSSTGPNDLGRNAPTICGPNGDTTAQTGTFLDTDNAIVSLHPFRGTSASAAHVAGAAALLLEQDPTLTPAELRSQLVEFADESGGLDNLTKCTSGSLLLPTPFVKNIFFGKYNYFFHQ